MYYVRILVGGDIYIIRANDKVYARYNPDGTPVYGSKNRLELESHAVLTLAREAESEWFNKFLHN